jgi:hypothetical protein
VPALVRCSSRVRTVHLHGIKTREIELFWNCRRQVALMAEAANLEASR